FDRHAFSDIVEQQGKDQQVATIHGFPQILKVRASGIGRPSKLLQMFNRTERVFVYCVSMIEIAHYQRIDASELRQDLCQQAEALQWAQRHSWKIRGQNFPEGLPGHLQVLRLEFRVLQDVGDASLRAPAERHSSPGRVGKQLKENRTVGNLLCIE